MTTAVDNCSSPNGKAPEGAALQVTLWFRKGDKGFEFNHLQDGHSEADKPTSRFPSQKGWASAVWVKELAWLDAGVPPRVLHDPEKETVRRVATRLA